MKKWLRLFIKLLEQLKKISPHKVKDFLLVVVTLALVGYGLWMLRIMEQLVKIAGNP